MSTLAELLSSVTSSYPFMRWAIKIIGPMHKSRQKCVLLVLTNYFSKWMEAEAFTKIRDAQVESFIWCNIICRHGVSYGIVTNNGSHFILAQFEGFCAKWKICLSKFTLRYPQGNGQAEAINKILSPDLRSDLT